MLARAVVVTLLTSAAFAASPAEHAAAAFVALAAGPAAATMQSVPVSAAPVAIVSGREVTVSWTPTTLTGGTLSTSYTVRRYDTSDVAQTILAACDAVTTTSCVEQNVPIGTWTYSVQAGMGSWTGAEGSKSATVTVATSSFVLDSTAPIVSLPAIVTGTVASFLFGETLTYRLDSAVGTVLAGSPSTVTSSASMAVSVTVPAGTSDAPHSIFVVGSGGTVASAAIDIVIPPVRQSMEMRDVNGNGKVDQVTVVFDDTLAAYTAGVAPWTLANVPSGGSLASVSVAGNTATLTITEGPGAADTAVASFTVALSANSAGIRDVNNHQSSFAATAPTDLAAPVRLTLNMLDNDGDGKVDGLTATFSETLAAYTAGNTPWTLANVPSNGTLASVAGAAATITLTITEGAGAANTAVGTMTVAMAPNAGGARDAAGNVANSFGATAPTDQAAPARLTLSLFDTNVNGRVDRVTTTFSETLAAYTAGTTPWTLTNVPSGATVFTVGAAAATITLTITEGVGAADTAVGAMTVAMATDAVGARDAAGNLSSFGATAPTDGATPLRQSSEMFDDNVDGKVDRVLVTFSETLASFTAPATVFTLTSAPSGATLSNVTVTGNQATLALTQGAGAATTAVGAFRTTLTANALGIRDAANNQSSYAAVAPTDRAAPALVTLSLLDNNGNGRVDRVTALFSEPLQASYTAANTPWTLTNIPSNGSLLSVSQAASTLTLILTEGVGAGDTTVGTMTVAMASNAGGARDATGNLGAFTARTPLDAARPAAVGTITDTPGATNGRAQSGDTLVITFSEPLLPTSVPTSTTVTLTDPVGAGNDTLTMIGVSNGARTTGTTNYVTGDGGVASFANSPVALSNANKTITITIGPACTGTGCATLATAAAGIYSFVAATTLTDVPGNLAATAAKTQSIALF
jgi:hypothetical protein